jgi:hypothetical protein
VGTCLNTDDRSREALELATRQISDGTIHHDLQLKHLNVFIFDFALILG